MRAEALHKIDSKVNGTNENESTIIFCLQPNNKRSFRFQLRSDDRQYASLHLYSTLNAGIYYYCS